MQYLTLEKPGQCTLGKPFTNQNSHPSICQLSNQAYWPSNPLCFEGSDFEGCDLTFQVINMDQPALLSTYSRKTLRVNIKADFVRKCSTTNQQPTVMNTTKSKAIQPKLRALTTEFISQHCTCTLFQGLGFLRAPVDFEMDLTIKPVHATIHCQPISKLEKIKSTLNTYKVTGQLARVSQRVSTMVIREQYPIPTKPGKICICLDPSQTLNKAIRQPKYIMPTLKENLQKLHDTRTRRSRTSPSPCEHL